MQTTFIPFSVLFYCYLFLHGVTGQAQTLPTTPSNQLKLPAADYEINFRWQGDTLNTVWEPYASLLIPVQLPHCPHVFYMQFDSGSPYSLFYRNKLKAIQQRYAKTFMRGDSLTTLRDFTFRAGGHSIVATEMIVKQFDDTGVNWKKNSIEIIGTIGMDFIDNKIRVMDYPARKLIIGAAIPASLATQLTTFDFHYAGKRILLPAQIKGRKTILYFDTGSSAFELLTDQETSTALALSGSTPARYPVKSWGKTLTANTLASHDSITLAAEKLPLHHVTYMEGVSDVQVKQMRQMGIGGMTGNKLFRHSILVIDTKNRKFGVVRKK